MKYLHVKNIEKYHPKFKDRDLVWCKLYFSTLNTDPEFMLLDEIDKWRYFAFVMLELQLKKLIPLEPKFLILKGFDFRKRKLDITINAIYELVEICDIPISDRYQNDTLDKEKRREEKSDDIESKSFFGKYVNMYVKEYSTLCDRFGKSTVDDFIEKINDWISSKGKKPFQDYPATIRNWIKKDSKEDKKEKVEW